MKKICVNLPAHPYEILIGANILPEIGACIKKLSIGNSAFVITNTTVADLYLNPLTKSLKQAGVKDIGVYRMPDGERYKNAAQWIKATRHLTDFDDSRNKKVFIINLGGGVVGDLGGFVAATYHRGIRYIQIPTTLLACVDSGVGGKVGVNLGDFKNCVGAFWHPRLVFCDTALLATLSGRQFKSGLAEVIKYGVSLDNRLFEYLEKNYENLCNRTPDMLAFICEQCYRLKAGIVERDSNDTKDIRIVLNYGHTIGHAVESASHYSYTHGESISIGMACANDIARSLGIVSDAVCRRVETILQKVKLPLQIKNCGLDGILQAMRNDKKFVHGKNRFVLLEKIGLTRIVENVPHDIICTVLRNRIRGRG